MRTKLGIKQQGMTFIEVLVALVIIVSGILGAVAMQASAKKGSFDAMQRSLASALAQDIIERMRNNDPNALASYAGTDFGAALNAEPARCRALGDECTPAQIVANDLYEWELALMGADVKIGEDSAGGLVSARGCVVVTNVNQVSVTISWEARTETSDGGTENCGAASEKRRQLNMRAYIF